MIELSPVSLATGGLCPRPRGQPQLPPVQNQELGPADGRSNALKIGLQTGGLVSVQQTDGRAPGRGAPICRLLAHQNLLKRSSSLTRSKILALVVRVVTFRPKPSQQNDATTLPCKMARRRLDSTVPFFWAAR